MRVALIVSPRKACQLYHVAAPKAAEAVKRVCLGIDHERRHAVFVTWDDAIGAPRAADFTELARPGEPICQVYYWHGLFGCVYRLRVGDAPISRGIGGFALVRAVVRFHLRANLSSQWLVCSPGVVPRERLPGKRRRLSKGGPQSHYRAVYNIFYV